MVTTKNKNVPSTTEESPAAETPKNEPIWSQHTDEVWANVYAFTNQRKNGETFTNYSTTFSRSYKDSHGKWKTTRFYGFEDLGKLVELAQRAHAYIASLQQAKEQNAPEPEAQQP